MECGYIFAFLSKQQLEINDLPVNSSGFSPAHVAPGTPYLCCSPPNCSSQERAGTKAKGKQVGPGPFLQLFSSRTRLPLAHHLEITVLFLGASLMTGAWVLPRPRSNTGVVFLLDWQRDAAGTARHPQDCVHTD